MITQTEDKSIDVDYDIFSIAGRTALVGGGLYALNKSVNDGVFKNNTGNTFKRRENAHTQGLKSLFKQDLKTTTRSEKPDYGFKNSSFFNIKDSLVDKEIKHISNFEDIADRFSGGYKGYSSALPDALESLKERIHQVDGVTPTIGVRYNKEGQVDYVSFKTKAGSLRVHTVDSNGLISNGSSAQNKYVARSFYSHNGTNLGQVYGSDVGMATFFTENYDRINNGEISLKEVNDAYQSSLYYSDKQFGDTVEAMRSNPEIIESMRASAIEDPLLRFNKNQNGKRQPLGRRSKKDFMKKRALEGMAQGSAADIAKGIIHLTDAPHYSIPFLSETNNPKQLFRNVKYKPVKGSEEFISYSDALFLDKESMGLLREELGKSGVNLGELAPEQLLINKSKAGTIIDSTRSLQIDSNKVSDASDFLLNKMAKTAGLSTEEFSYRIKDGGFGSFDKNTQDLLRNISVDDYKNYIRGEMQKSFKKRKAFLSVNKSLDHVGGDLETQSYYKEAQRLKTQGRLDSELQSVEESIKTNAQKYRERNVFGLSTDGSRSVKLEKAHQGLLLDNLHYSKGKLTVQLRREKRLGVGDKIHDPSGELKAIIKGEVDNLPRYLENVYKRKHKTSVVPEHIKKRFQNTTFIANEEAMKTTVQGRNAYSVLVGITNEAGLSSNKKVLGILDHLHSNYSTMNDEAKMDIWKQLNAIAETEGKTLHGLSGMDTGIGFSTRKMVGYGNAAIDMGAGGLGFFSERHIKLFESMGLHGLSSDIIGRRVRSGAAKTYTDFDLASKLLKDTKYQGTFNLDDLSQNFFENIFPELNNEDVKALDLRKQFLHGKSNRGAAFVNLGEEIEGINKIAIFDTEKLMGHIGHQIGSAGEYKRYTELDSLTKKILYEARKRKRDPQKLQNLIKNYNVAISQMGDGLRKSLLKDKVSKSLYGQITSAGEGMAEYSEKLAKQFGTKGALPFVAAVGDKKFIELFGEEALNNFERTGTSGAWAVATREPVEGLSSVPVNVVPESAFKDISKLGDEQIAVLTNPKNNILKMLFGDTDGDSFSLIPALTNDSSKELQELAFGNSENAIAFRSAQNVKTKMSLKGQKQKSILETSFEEMRLATFHAKDLEKGFVGIASNAMKPLHELNALKHGNGINPDKFYRIENVLHTFTENIIKGKHQTLDQLKGGKAQRVLEALTGVEEFKEMSNTDRIKYFRDFTDQLFLGEASPLASRIRKGEKGQEIIQSLTDANVDADEILNNDWFRNMTSDEAMGDLIEATNLSKRAGSAVDDAIELAEEEVSQVLSASGKKQRTLIESLHAGTEETKQMFNGVGKNIAKYALLPAAAFGLLGTVFHSRSKMNSSGETSDNQKNVYKKGSSINMDAPKHMRPEIQGQVQSGFKIDQYASGKQGGRMQINDNTKSFDHYDMQDKMNKGY